MTELFGVEKCVGQILLNFGIVKDSELATYVNMLSEDFPDDPITTLPEMFKKINARLKAMGLQIRSLSVQERVILDQNEEEEDEDEVPGDRLIRVMYHGIVNLEDDFAAEKFGTNLKADELVFCKDCVERLVHNKYQSLHDLVYLSEHAKDCRQGWKSDMEALIGRLIDNKWLQRTDRAFVELGPRAHLELRPLIESTTLQMVVGEEGDGDLAQELLGQLPQIIFH
mmetsp:Transcript_25223/g.42551  ORF Transcript_25223/g.42551 Transcript_25223/m.42551 type:complete len:226 (+) Transcript_25223:137-814(+)